MVVVVAKAYLADVVAVEIPAVAKVAGRVMVEVAGVVAAKTD